VASGVTAAGWLIERNKLPNRGLVAAVSATPFINFALFEDYRPHPLPSFVSL
jgi:hypothetical protein